MLLRVEPSADGKCLCVIASRSSTEFDEEVVGVEELRSGLNVLKFPF
jgi:hypothetical protein